MNAVQRLNGNG